jgi:tRNA(Ile)-lysidine synthase
VPSTDLPSRFRDRLRALGIDAGGAHVLVALSGGMDSVVLLHLLRFETGVRVSAAHFDHAMRSGSAADARWVRGLCAAWGVPLAEGAAHEELRTEEDARRARYRFLREQQKHSGATHLATAHHADDQAETVLFRVLRGTGVAGLAGIPEKDGSLVRPLLPFWRAELRRYARENGVRWRPDPSNQTLGPARNQIRNDLIPRIESTLAPGAKKSLVRLARLARAREEEWDVLVRRATAECVRWEEEGAVLVRGPLAAYDWPLAARVVRGVLRHFGVVPGRAGTRSALQFITSAPSGRTFRLPGGTHLVRAGFDAATVEPVKEAAPLDRALVIDGPSGEGTMRVGGRELRVRWGSGEGEAFASSHLPLTARGWQPGDRMRTRAGTKKLKKLFLEARIPRHRRGLVPVLADAAGRVLWAAGIARAADAEPPPGAATITISITDA